MIYGHLNNITISKPLQETLSESEGGLLASWSSGTSNADFTVAQDGSGTHKTITEAIDALDAMDNNRPSRPIIYVKSGVYNEKGYSTISSVTFDVSGDGFWARDMTFENRAGPRGHQAVALRVSSDLSVFYKCSFKGYQDTLLQFYRDCHIYGTIDFIFGDASVVKPAYDFDSSKDSITSYLGRPWKQYSRTLFLKTNLDGLIDPNGWGEWIKDFALSTLYYGEYMNTRSGASTQNRVTWSGFHV
ncbi:hypothetical protein GYH30_044361 [Glycine max]|uniref:Pectinesterase n=2 Tax=Glycine subgen. Soja TaxID=1462606 RepID=K7MFK8_SOYBN|nr:hypothetical protein GYH30_044361 [Glycine max]RZB59926.1 putative pectinesterase/pectinesterase inhibitor 36 [Glycine soja]